MCRVIFVIGEVLTLKIPLSGFVPNRGNFGIAEGLISVMLVCELSVIESKIDYNQLPKTYHHFNCLLDSLERQVTSLISFVPILCVRILSVLLISELQIKFAFADIDVGYTD